MSDRDKPILEKRGGNTRRPSSGYKTCPLALGFVYAKNIGVNRRKKRFTSVAVFEYSLYLDEDMFLELDKYLDAEATYYDHNGNFKRRM